MNPLTNMKNVLKLSEGALKSDSKTSWHDMYKDSAWIFVGGLPYDLTEGDILCIFSQYGEVVNINLVRDKISGKQKGFCFICYEDQRSTILAVDNLNGIKILGRTIRVDHVSDYKVPKENDKTDEETKKLHMEGCAPKPQIPSEKIKKEVQTFEKFDSNIRLPQRLPVDCIKKESKYIKEEMNVKLENIKKEKKVKKLKKEKKSKIKQERLLSEDSNSTNTSEDEEVDESIKQDKYRSRNRELHRNGDERQRKYRRRNLYWFFASWNW